MDGITFSGTGRSKKLAKVAVAKNALQCVLNQKLQAADCPVFYESTVPSITYNQGLVNVDFTSDDPTDANFIINEMNRIQNTAVDDAFQTTQIQSTGTPPLSAQNGTMKAPPPPPGKSQPGKTPMGNETNNVIEQEEEEEEIKSSRIIADEDQDDSGLVEEEDCKELSSEEDELSRNSNGLEDIEPSLVGNEAENNQENVCILQEVELTADILKEIQISMNYDEYKADVQSKYFLGTKAAPVFSLTFIIFLEFP